MPRGLRRALLVLGFGFAVFLGGPNPAARASTFMVTTTADSGAGSLRQAIADANANPGTDNVFFAIPGGGPHVISLSTPLPALAQPVIVDATTQSGFVNSPLVQVRPAVPGQFDGFFIGATGAASKIRGLSITDFDRGIVSQAQADYERNYIGLTPGGVAAGNAIGIRSDFNGQQSITDNVISSNTTYAVDISGTSVTTDIMAIHQNRIGTTPDGMTARPNGAGIRLHDTRFSVQDNIISGNTGDAIQVEFTQASGSLLSFIQINKIGVKQDNTALGNGGNGVLVTYTGTDPANVGMQLNQNTIANNAGNGVRVVQAAGVQVLNASFYDNTLLDIDLVNGNRLQNSPAVIGAADDGGQVTAAASLDTLPNTSYMVEFYVSQACRGDGQGPGAIRVGTAGFTTGNSGGVRTFNSSSWAAVPGYNVITATATVIGPEPNTSEFSNCVTPSTATVDIGDASINENDPAGVVNVPLTLSAPAPIGAFITVTSQDGTATTTNNDYNNASGFVFVPAGAMTASVPVTINDDVIDEVNETLTLTLSSPGPGLVLNDNMATVTINDDDVPKIYVTGPTVNEGDPNGFVSITVGADVPPVQDATVTLSTSDLDAIAGADYTAVTNQQVTILAGTFGTDVNIPINDDAAVEPDEHFFVTISNPTYGALMPSGDVGLVTIVDNDLKLVVNDLSVNEAAGTASVQVTSNAPAPQDVNFQFFTDDGTAVEPDDYAFVFDAATLSAGTTSAVIEVPILQDTTEEVHETFTVTIFDAPGATIVDDEATVTIIDDDGPPITIHDITVNENVGTVNVSVTLSQPALNDVTFDAQTAAGSATDGADYTGGSAPGTITAGQTGTTLSVPILQDTADELAETFTITLTNIVGATVGDATATVTITDDDVPAWSIGDLTVGEAVGTAQVPVTLTIAPVQTYRVNYATSTGTAGAADFTATSGTLTFIAGQTTDSINVPINNDTFVEATEAFTVTLSSPSAGSSISDGSATVSIMDNDVTSLSIQDISVGEGDGPLVFTISATQAPSGDATVHVQTSGGSATSGADFTAVSTTATILSGQTSTTVSIPITQDTIDELAEDFTVTLSSPTNATIGGAAATVTITDDDVPALSVGDVTVAENAGPAVVRVAATIAPIADATVRFTTTTGTAGAADFTAVDSTATITAGSLFVDVPVPITNDTIDENNEAFTVTLTNPTNASIADSTATVTITDDDVPALSVGDLTVAEDNGPAVVRITATTAPIANVSVRFTTSTGTAGAADFTAVDQVVTLTAGSLFVDTPVAITNDTIDEPAETFTVTLTNPANAAIADGSATVTITDDDVPALSVNDVTVNEGVGTATVRVSATIAPVVDAAVRFTTVNGGTDFTTVDQVVTIPAGQLFVDVPVAINDDGIDEANETFGITLTNPTNATIADGAGVLTITDNDVPVLSVGDVTVAENAGTAVVRVSADIAPVVDATVRFMTETSSAGPADFTGVDQVVTIPAGALFVDVPVTIANDGIDEANEAFGVTLSNPTNATVGRGAATVTITDDDVPVLSVGDVTVAENAGPAVVRVASSIAPVVDVTARFVTSVGTAGAADFTAVDQIVTIPAGSLFVDVPVAITNDAASESSEMFTVTLSNPTNATLGRSGATVTITDDDAATLSIADATVAENAGTVPLRVTTDIASTTDITVRVTTTPGSATTADFTAADQVVTIPAGQLFVDLPVAITNDTADEVNETFTASLSSPTGATIADGSATVTIIDDDVVSISVGDLTVGESVGNASVPVTLSAPAAAEVSFTATCNVGSASAADFLVCSSIGTIPAGATSASVLVPITQDSVDELNETFTVALSGVVGANTGRTPATVTIADDDVPAITVNAATVGEGDGNATVSITTDIAPVVDVTVQVQTTAVSATAGADYTTVSTTATILAGATSTSVDVPVLQDTLDEAAETFTVSLSSPTNATIAVSSATITIQDDDVPQLTVHAANVGESDNTVAVSITSDIAPLADVVVHATTSDDTAVAGSDYTATEQDVTIPAGSLSATFNVPILSDTANEGDEAFDVTLSAPSSNARIAGATASVTILDDDAVRLSIGDVRVDESVGSAVLPLTLTDPAPRDITFTATPTAGTATTADFTSSPVSGSIPTGATSGTVLIPITNDIADEVIESFTVSLSDVRGAGLDRATATVSIVDDDVPAVTVRNRSADEGDGTARVVISSNTAPLEPITMHFETAGGTATSGVDFTPVSTTATLPAGQTTIRVDVPILQDSDVEERESFTVRISSLSYGTIERGEGTVRISDDDSPSATTIFPPRPTTSSTAPPPVVTTTTEPTAGVTTTTVVQSTTTLLPTITTLPPTPPTSADVIVTNETPPPTTRVTTPPTTRVTVLETPTVTAAPTADEHATDEHEPDEHAAAPTDDHEAAPEADHAESESHAEEGHSEEHELDHADISHDVPHPHDVSMNLSDLVKSAGVAGALLLLFAFPSELFDATWEHNEARIRRFFSFMPTFKAPATPPARFFSSLFCVVGAGLIFTFLESKPGFDWQTVMVTLGCMVAVALTNFGLVTPEFLYMRGRVHEKGVLNTVPGGLIVAALCVVASKLLKFHPGYVYGVVAGWEFHTRLSKRDEGVLGMISAWALIAFAFAAWFLREPVGRLVDETHAAPWVALEVSLTVLFILAVENALIGLIPLRLIKGYRLWKWSKLAWFGTTFVVAMVFTHILVTPNNGSFSPSHASTYKILMIFGVFGALSVIFYAWFRFRPDPYLKSHPEAAHGH